MHWGSIIATGLIVAVVDYMMSSESQKRKLDNATVTDMLVSSANPRSAEQRKILADNLNRASFDARYIATFNRSSTPPPNPDGVDSNGNPTSINGVSGAASDPFASGARQS